MPSTSASVFVAAAGFAATLTAPAVRGAGGQFDVDDASILDPGRCQVETWAMRAPATPATLLHVGPGCRTGPLEASLNIEWLAHPADPATRTRTLGPQLKWAAPWSDRLAVGAVATAAYDVDQGSWPQRTVYGIATWTALPSLAVHANAGADWSRGLGRTRRWGLSGEWTVSDRWSAVAEHLDATAQRTNRVGLRLRLAGGPSLDVTAARFGPDASTVWGVGLNTEFGR